MREIKEMADIEEMAEIRWRRLRRLKRWRIIFSWTPPGTKCSKIVAFQPLGDFAKVTQKWLILPFLDRSRRVISKKYAVHHLT